MVEPKFKCNVCKDNKIYSSQEANEHRQKTGHNEFGMIQRRKQAVEKVTNIKEVS